MRKAGLDHSIFAHLRALSELGRKHYATSTMFRPPARIVAGRVFKDWENLKDRKPEAHLVEAYAKYLDEKFPAPQGKQWLQFFQDGIPYAYLYHEVANGGAPPTLESNDRSLQRAKALEGCYQIIRPFTKRPSKFVLEAMAISIGPEAKIATMSMYSHKFVNPELLYQGEITVSNPYTFALLQRPYSLESSVVNAGYANRCVSIYTSHLRFGARFKCHPALSGIIVRGLTGEVKPKGTIAVPIVAIRVPGQASSLKRVQPSKVEGLSQVGDASSTLLCGEIEPHTLKNTFEFAERLFSELRGKITDNFGIFTISPEEVSEAIKIAAASRIGSAQQWPDIVKSDLAAA